MDLLLIKFRRPLHSPHACLHCETHVEIANCTSSRIWILSTLQFSILSFKSIKSPLQILFLSTAVMANLFYFSGTYYDLLGALFRNHWRLTHWYGITSDNNQKRALAFPFGAIEFIVRILEELGASSLASENDRLSSRRLLCRILQRIRTSDFQSSSASWWNIEKRIGENCVALLAMLKLWNCFHLKCFRLQEAISRTWES